MCHSGPSVEIDSFSTEQPYRFIGNELYSGSGLGLYDFKARLYDPAIGRFLSVDPLAEKYPGISPYLYCAGNPVNYVDRSGQFPETLWDIANVVMDVKSLASNLRQGKIGASIVDGVGLTLDAAAAALPFVPGGVGAGIKATRLADNALDAVGNVKDTGKSLSRIKEALIEAKSRIGLSPNESLPKFEGKHGSPSRGDQIKGYRLGPPHDKNGSESVPHINYWDYTNGKRKNGGVSGSVEIKE